MQSTHLQFGLLHLTFPGTVEAGWFIVVVVVVDFIIFFLVVIDRAKIARECRPVITILCARVVKFWVRHY